jgi:type VI secretion system protein VasD
MNALRLFVILAGLVLTACGSHKVNVDISSTANLNVNRYNEALPVVVRIYQLTDAQAFNNASFEDLWKKDALTLGSSLLTKEELTLQPSSKETISFEKHEAAQYVGLFAMFRNRDDNKWRIVKQLSDGYFSFSTQMNVLVTSNTVEFADQKQKTAP